MATITKTYIVPKSLEYWEAATERLRKQRVFVNGTHLPFICEVSVALHVLPDPASAETAPRFCQKRVGDRMREAAYSNGCLTTALGSKAAFLDVVAGERGGTFLDKPFTLVVQTLDAPDAPDAPDPNVVSEDRYLLCRVTEYREHRDIVDFYLYVGLAVPSDWQTQDSRYCQLLQKTFPAGVPG